jgi:hypothetical protein
MAFCVEGVSRTGPDGTVRHIGNYEKLEDAIAAAKRVVDRFLLQEFAKGTSPEIIFTVYQNLGEFPYIFRDDDKTINVHEFNHLKYAMAECATLCRNKKV